MVTQSEKTAEKWIAGKKRASARRRSAPSSYEAKHALEGETGLYVTDAQFQDACRRLGVDLFWPTGSSTVHESPYVGIAL